MVFLDLWCAQFGELRARTAQLRDGRFCTATSMGSRWSIANDYVWIYRYEKEFDQVQDVFELQVC